MDEKTAPIHFIDYDKISDTLMYFDQNTSLKFNVILSKKTSGGSRKFFSREVVYNNSYYNANDFVGLVKREMNFYYSIEIYQNYKNNIVLRMNDVVLLQMVLNHSILPWFVGSKRIFGINADNRMYIKGKWSEIPFNLSDYKYVSFMPIVYTFEDGKDSEGIRLVLNDPSIFIDMSVDNFMKFYYIICNTDMYACANSMVNYLTSDQTHGINQYQFDGSKGSVREYYQNDYDDGNGSGESFFTKKDNKKKK